MKWRDGGDKIQGVLQKRLRNPLPAQQIPLERSLKMGRIGMPELLIILAIIIIVFGANRLPGLGKGIGSAIRNFKDGIKDETAEHKS